MHNYVIAFWHQIVCDDKWIYVDPLWWPRKFVKKILLDLCDLLKYSFSLYIAFIWQHINKWLLYLYYNYVTTSDSIDGQHRIETFAIARLQQRSAQITNGIHELSMVRIMGEHRNNIGAWCNRSGQLIATYDWLNGKWRNGHIGNERLLWWWWLVMVMFHGVHQLRKIRHEVEFIIILDVVVLCARARSSERISWLRWP